MTEQWQELKETITEMCDSNGTCTQQEVCKFLVNYMEILEKQMQEPCEDVISREYLFKVLDDFCGHDRTATITLDTLADLVYDLPSVKPQKPKTIQEIQAESEKYQKAFEDGYEQGYAQARFDYEQEPCEDCISREPFTDSTICEGFSCDECSFNRKDKGGCILEERIMKLPSVKPQEPKWIPVSERLPEERDWYLAVFKEKDTGYQLIPRVSEHIGENKWRIIDEEAFVKNYMDILKCVAWMPLPEPYKTESEVIE